MHEWEAPAGPRLARLASLVQFGDYLSLYLALLAGVDPTPDPQHRRVQAAAGEAGREHPA